MAKYLQAIFEKYQDPEEGHITKDGLDKLLKELKISSRGDEDNDDDHDDDHDDDDHHDEDEPRSAAQQYTTAAIKEVNTHSLNVSCCC